VDKPLKSVMHGQCDARPTVTFPVAEHHRPLAGTKLYCLVIEAHGCSNLPRVVAWRCAGGQSNPRPLDHESDTLTTAPPSYPQAYLRLQKVKYSRVLDGSPSQSYTESFVKVLLRGPITKTSYDFSISHHIILS